MNPSRRNAPKNIKFLYSKHNKSNQQITTYKGKTSRETLCKIPFFVDNEFYIILNSLSGLIAAKL